jgi:hypothetical protein
MENFFTAMDVCILRDRYTDNTESFKGYFAKENRDGPGTLQWPDGEYFEGI